MIVKYAADLVFRIDWSLCRDLICVLIIFTVHRVSVAKTKQQKSDKAKSQAPGAALVNNVKRLSALISASLNAGCGC